MPRAMTRYKSEPQPEIKMVRKFRCNFRNATGMLTATCVIKAANKVLAIAEAHAMFPENTDRLSVGVAH